MWIPLSRLLPELQQTMTTGSLWRACRIGAGPLPGSEDGACMGILLLRESAGEGAVIGGCNCMGTAGSQCFRRPLHWIVAVLQEPELLPLSSNVLLLRLQAVVVHH